MQSLYTFKPNKLWSASNHGSIYTHYRTSFAPTIEVTQSMNRQRTDTVETADPQRQIKLGTRASPLALCQSEMVAHALTQAHGWAHGTIELETIITKGDTNLDRKLAEIGGKGLFTEELEAGLRDTSLDLAVHSLKDLPTVSPAGLTLGAILPREDARDVLVPRTGLAFKSLEDLPKGARLGTASLRRGAQLLAARPDLHIEPLRGNVGTRMQRLETQDLHATLLAAAGLNRLALTPDAALALDPKQIVPAAGQGALAVQCRSDDTQMLAWLRALHCPDTADCVAAERSFLNALDGSCRTPIAAYATLGGATLEDATLDDDTISLHGRLLREDGQEAVEGTSTGPRQDAIAMGQALAAQLRDQAPHLVS
jgi:hydroxymethylbilane synthase